MTDNGKKLYSLIIALTSAHFLVQSSTTAFGGTFDLDANIVNKLNSAKDKITTVASPGAGYSLQSVSYGGSFATKPMRFEQTVTVPEPLSASSLYTQACFPGIYKLQAQVSLTTSSGEEFSSEEALSTDTTVKVSGSYATVNVEATTNIKTNNVKTSSKKTEQISASKQTSSVTKVADCATFDQPVFFAASGSATKLVWKNISGSDSIKYSYDTYPSADSNTADWTTAMFSATFLKPGTVSMGQPFDLVFYDSKKKEIGRFRRTTQQCMDNNGANRTPSYNCSIQYHDGNTDKWFDKHNPSYYSVSFGGSYANIDFYFNDKKGNKTAPSKTSTVTAIPSGWSGKNLGSINMTNWDYKITGSDTKIVRKSLSSVLLYEDVKHTTNGIYNASSMQSSSMDVAFTYKTYAQLLRDGGNAAVLKKCAPNLKEAKIQWAAACKTKALQTYNIAVPVN